VVGDHEVQNKTEAETMTANTEKSLGDAILQIARDIKRKVVAMGNDAPTNNPGGWPLDRHIHQVAEQISCLTKAVRDFTDEFKCSRSHPNLVTKDDLKEMEKRMAIKLSDLKTEVAGIRAQVTKIWGEQQKKYDDLVVEFDKLKASLENVTLPDDVETDLTDFKAQLQAFDDTIPDTTA
jgi:hypothetical protein